jgi:hypothetical protein
MMRVYGVLGGMASAMLLFSACSDTSTAPSDATENRLEPPSFHVISARCDFMTGGGFVGSGGQKVTYGVHAGRSRGGTVFGHFNVVDHRNGNRYQSTRIRSYGQAVAPFFVSVPTTGVTRVVEGELRVNGGAVRSFTAYLNDSGEPGRRVDRIFFRVGSTEIISGARVSGLPSLRVVDGGNLQFHNHCIPGNPQSGK